MSFIFGASFNTIGAEDMIPFSALTSPEGLEDEDQIQVAYTDDRGLTQMHDFVYFGEWYNEDMDPVADDDGIPLGGSAWFISSSPKTITTSGEVRKSNYIHTFTEPSALISSAFPQSFCPNSANVSWGVSDETQIQTAYIDERGLTQMHDYVYFGSWYNEDMDELAEDDAIVNSGTGFWIILQDTSDTFSEVSPLAE